MGDNESALPMFMTGHSNRKGGGEGGGELEHEKNECSSGLHAVQSHHEG
jgi:hypothetical protein